MSENETVIRTLKNIAFINIRVAHEIRGAADGILPKLYKKGKFQNTLIVSPPGFGKTTLLRDLIRQISDGNTYGAGLRVGVVDERSELAGSYLGRPQNDLGMRTDVLDGCPKAQGMLLLLRSMSPQVIAVDELGGESDIEALNQLVSCGIRILGSVHGTNADDLRRKILPHAIERFVFIDHDEKGVRRYSIYDEAYRLLYSTVCGIGADKRLQQKKKGRYSDAV